MKPGRLIGLLGIVFLLSIIENTTITRSSLSSFKSPADLTHQLEQQAPIPAAHLSQHKSSAGHDDEIRETSTVERSLNEETIQSDLREWKSIWNDSIAKTKTSDMPLDKRQKVWKQLASQSEASMNLLQEAFEAFPIPKDSISLYNRHAANELISSLFQAHRNGRNFTMVASGGSATAGGGNPSVPQELRYYSKLAGYLNAMLRSSGNQSTVQWIGQGHGFRNSLHTAIFFDHFIPSDTDLLIWEFSINDPSIGMGKHELIMKGARNNLLVWLTRVKRMTHPPKVLLIYKWDPPFHRDNSTKIVSRAFESHGNLAKKFDFVVGHVHVAQYIDELELPNCKLYGGCPLMSDHCHPSKEGHMATAFMLLNLLNPFMVPEVAPATTAMDNDTAYEWSCGVDTEAKRILKKVMTTSSNEWRFPVGTWTHELPTYAQGGLVVGPKKGNSHTLGYEDPVRQDRQFATSIYMCDNPDQAGSFSVIARREPLTNVRVALMTFKNQDLMQTESFQVRLNGSHETTKGELVPLRVKRNGDYFAKWLCHISCPWGDSVDVYTFIFEEEQPIVHSMELCTPTIPVPKPKIQSVAFW